MLITTKKVTPDFTVFRYSHFVEKGRLTLTRKRPILVCEGKRENHMDMESLDEQCVDQAAYAFESRDSGSVVHILKWVGAEWWTHTLKRNESKRLSNNRDTTYLGDEGEGRGANRPSRAPMLCVISNGEISASHESIGELVEAIRNLGI